MKIKRFLELVYPGHVETAKAKLSVYLFYNADTLKLHLGTASKIASALDIDFAEFVVNAGQHRCHRCGCTQNDCRQCIKKTGAPCYWISPELCSACATEKDKIND